MNRRYLHLLCLLACTLAPLSCGQSVLSALTPTWTVLIYLDGDNDLDSSALRDLQEMRAAAPSPQVNVLVQMDLPATTTQRYRIANNSLELLDDLGELDMAAPRTLTDFLAWAGTSYPADRMVLVLWDHGFGWDQGDGPSPRSLFVDGDPGQDPNAGRRLPNRRVKQAIANSGLRIDVLGFDACTMGNIETLYEFRDVAGIVIASEEETESNGWDYRGLLSSLAAQPAMSIEAFAAEAVRTYGEFYETIFYPSHTLYDKRYTLSAFRTAPLEALAVEIDTLAASLTTALGGTLVSAATVSAIDAARANAQEIDRYLQSNVYVDLADLDRLLDRGSLIRPLLADALISEYHGADRPLAGGLSIVLFKLPESIQSGTYDPNYRNYDAVANIGNGGDFINQFHWDEFVAAYRAAKGI